MNAMSRETILRQYLDTLKGQYSHILIDCPTIPGYAHGHALAAANRVIIPVQAEYSLPAKGLEQLLPDRKQGEAADSPQAPDRRHTADDGGQPHQLCQGDRRPASGRPTAAKSRCSAPRFPIPSGQRKSAPRAKAFLPMTLMARWPRATRILTKEVIKL